MSHIHHHGDPRPSIEGLLKDPAIRAPLKSVLRSWARRDPVDAAEDAGLLALALERVADEACGDVMPTPVWRVAEGLGGADDRDLD